MDFIGGWSRRRLLPSTTKILDYSKKSRYSAQNSLGVAGTFFSFGMMETLLKSMFTDASQGSTLQTEVSKDSSLKHAMLTIFCTACNKS